MGVNNFETSYNSLRRSEIQKNLNAISFLLREAAAVFESTAIFAQSIFHLFALELEKHPDGVCVCVAAHAVRAVVLNQMT